MRASQYHCPDCPETFLTSLDYLQHTDMTGHTYRLRHIPATISNLRVEPFKKRTICILNGFQWEVTS